MGLNVDDAAERRWIADLAVDIVQVLQRIGVKHYQIGSLTNLNDPLPVTPESCNESGK